MSDRFTAACLAAEREREREMASVSYAAVSVSVCSHSCKGNLAAVACVTGGALVALCLFARCSLVSTSFSLSLSILHLTQQVQLCHQRSPPPPPVAPCLRVKREMKDTLSSRIWVSNSTSLSLTLRDTSITCCCVCTCLISESQEPGIPAQQALSCHSGSSASLFSFLISLSDDVSLSFSSFLSFPSRLSLCW